MSKFRTPVVATSIHPASADSGVNLNRGKKKGQNLPTPQGVGDYRAPRPRRYASSVTVLRVDPSTLRRSRAHSRRGNTGDAVLNAATIVARAVKSRETLRRLASA